MAVKRSPPPPAKKKSPPPPLKKPPPPPKASPPPPKPLPCSVALPSGAVQTYAHCYSHSQDGVGLQTYYKAWANGTISVAVRCAGRWAPRLQLACWAPRLQRQPPLR